MKKFILTEDDKKNILGMYGLINEQSSELNLPNEIFNIITDIEARFSYCEYGVVKSRKLNGKEVLNVFRDYVKTTIGFDTWNKLDNDTKSQIYSFAYQTDTTAGKPKYWWVKGLAQAIDSNFDRASESLEKAIEIIKSSKKLGSIYSDYLKVVKNQYGNISMGSETECNRKKIWGPRPDAIDRMLNGEDHEKVLDDWEKTYITGGVSKLSDVNKTNTNQTPKKEKVTTNTNQSQQSSPKKVVYSHTMNFSSLENLISVIKNDDYELLDKTFDVNEKPIVVIKDDKYRISFPKGTDKLTSLRLALNISSDYKNNKFPSKESLEGQGYKVWDEGTLQLQGEGVRNWALMYKKESENDSTSEIKFDNKSNKEKPSKTNTEPQDSKNIKPF
jgi:hypothetical protein